ncbi:biotin transporter BioY [Neptunicoccus cionae]|uniref:biotin transporter BioY n=1 Tax=Neptunicoccus cionae TaxID=2035344 RepID=UPI000C77F607|nr:biotin transporter BioY [Amylibacter cionae]PLS23521.1 BioY family transporter [Amylibacter cionae]
MERNIVYIAVFGALIAALGLLPKVTLMSGIPITAQSMGIMLCGTVLGARKGALAVLLFLALVALGLPLLAGGRGGLGVFTTPWAGFLFGFPVAAFVTGLVMRWLRGARVGVVAAVASVIGGIGALYAIAVPYYMVMTGAGLADAIATAALPFIPGDLVKAVVAGAITGTVYKARPRAVMSRA